MAGLADELVAACDIAMDVVRFGTGGGTSAKETK